MAKRKRLKVPPVQADETGSDMPKLETKSGYVFGVAPKPARAPIAQVAGDAAAQSALDKLADEMREARTSGRLVLALPLAAIREDHMVRDRMGHDPVEMDSLKASLQARGQQTPIEVVALEAGDYGLISGWRRVHALRALLAETGEARFGEVSALIKPIENVSDGYVAMVEENEIRANLSFYERAHLACAAVELGIYPDAARAVQVLFANAPAARRSKILSFARLHKGLGDVLRFPVAIPEKLGLALVSALEGQEGFARRLRDALRKAPAQDAAEERARLEQALRKVGQMASAPDRQQVTPEITLVAGRGRVVLSGAGVTEALQRDLAAWLAAR